MSFYLTTLYSMLKEPGRYFQTMVNLPEETAAVMAKPLTKSMTLKKSFVFLLISCLISTMAALTTNDPVNPLVEGGIYFLNGMGMAVIAAGVGFLIMTMFMQQRVSFSRFFSIYALAWGTTVLVVWIPWAVWMAEPWKWWLVGMGMTKNFGFKPGHAAAVLISSIVVMMIFFSTMLPVITSIRAAMASI